MESPPTSPVPVFVDETGGRALRARTATRVIAALVVIYALLFAAALTGTPGVNGVSLPGIGPLVPSLGGTSGPATTDRQELKAVGGTVSAHRAASAAAPPTNAATPAPNQAAAPPGTPAGRGSAAARQPAADPVAAAPVTQSSDSHANGQGPNAAGPPRQSKAGTGNGSTKGNNGGGSSGNGHGRAGSNRH